MVEQGGLAHARLAADHQHPALADPDSLGETGEHPDLTGPAAQRCAASALPVTP
jgi:hypothetical protein